MHPIIGFRAIVAFMCCFFDLCNNALAIRLVAIVAALNIRRTGLPVGDPARRTLEAKGIGRINALIAAA
jgi:hypothetical protein